MYEAVVREYSLIYLLGSLCNVVVFSRINLRDIAAMQSLRAIRFRSESIILYRVILISGHRPRRRSVKIGRDFFLIDFFFF